MHEKKSQSTGNQHTMSLQFLQIMLSSSSELENTNNDSKNNALFVNVSCLYVLFKYDTPGFI